MTFGRALKNIYVVAAKRIPFGTYGGKLIKHTPHDLQEIASRAAIQSVNMDPSIIDSVIVGNCAPVTTDGGFMPRHVSSRIGIPVESPACIVNRLCGSGFQSIVFACQEMGDTQSQVVMTGGVECLSACPFYLSGVRFGAKLGENLSARDPIWGGLNDTEINMMMGFTAENLAVKYNITREESDQMALASQQRWKAAQDAGRFKEEMAPITLKTRKGEVIMDQDEHPRPSTTLEGLSKLPPVFKKGGTVTPGNSSGLSDGAGCVILATEEGCAKHNLKPLVRVAGYSVAGCDPKIMGIGPVPAIRHLLKQTDLTVDDLDLAEVNEAFAPQYLAVVKDLGLDPEKTNVNGGAVALGHPMGATGSRITAHLTHELRRTGGKYAIGSACIGGGQGIAVLLENVN